MSDFPSYTPTVYLCPLFWLLAFRAYRRLMIQNSAERLDWRETPAEWSDWLLFLGFGLVGFYFLIASGVPSG